MTLPPSQHPGQANRRYFIGGSDARIIMGTDETALVRLWREKRGEVEPPDYSDNLIVQLGVATEPINRRWYEKTTGQVVGQVQTWIRHPVIRWRAAGAMPNTLRGVPAAAHTCGNVKSRPSMRIGMAVACPSGGTPPIANPVTCRTSFGVAIRTD